MSSRGFGGLYRYIQRYFTRLGADRHKNLQNRLRVTIRLQLFKGIGICLTEHKIPPIRRPVTHHYGVAKHNQLLVRSSCAPCPTRKARSSPWYRLGHWKAKVRRIILQGQGRVKRAAPNRMLNER